LKKGAIVWGGHFHALGLVRQLARHDIPVVVLDHEICISKFSKYTKKFIRSPKGDDDDRCLSFFMDLAQNEQLKGWIVFPSDDEGLSFLSRHKPELQAYFQITTPEWDITRFAYDKRATYTKASSMQIPIPKTIIPQSRDDIHNLDWEYPIIVKPAIMRTFKDRTGKKVLRAKNQQELFAAYDLACQYIPCNEILIQDEIPNAYKHLYSYCPWFKDGRALSYVMVKRPRQHPMEFGHASTYAVTVNIPEMKTLADQFLQAIDFYGICEVEFLYDERDSTFKMLEVNPRIWGWHTIANAVELPLGYYLFMDQIGTQLEKYGYETNKQWIRLLTDTPIAIQSIMNGKISLQEYIRSIKGKKEYAVFSLDDPLPFFAELCMLPYLWKKRGF